MMEMNHNETKFDSSIGPDEANPENESRENLIMKTPVPQIVKTLPDSLNSMVDVCIEIENDDARELIEMLGKKLGINDYRTNLATFWLLDTMALEVMRIKDKINATNLGIVVSWIAGEAKLIQEKCLNRKKFFEEMEIMFVKMFGQLCRGKPLMYWEDAVTENNVPLTEQGRLKLDEREDIASGPSSGHELEGPNELSAYEVVTVTNGDPTNLNERSQTVLDNWMKVLEAIIESTYVMYGNGFHYATVYAALAQPIEIHSYRFPYTLRLPRPVKAPLTPSPKTKAPNEGVRQKTRSKTDKEKSSQMRAGKEKVKSKLTTEIASPLLPMINEEMMNQERKQILPLMESNEALYLLEQFTKSENVSVITGTDTGKKGKRKIKPTL